MDSRPLPSYSIRLDPRDLLAPVKYAPLRKTWLFYGPGSKARRHQYKSLSVSYPYVYHISSDYFWRFQYKKHHIEEYRLQKGARDKPVMSAEDLHHILFTHWALDTTTYADERQRVQVATGLLIASYTGCRPISLFDTGRKILSVDKSEGNAGGDGCSSTRGSTDNSSVSDVGSDPGFDSDSDSCSDPNRKAERTGSIRYRDISLLLLPPIRLGGVNVLVAKVTLVHIKGGQRRSRSSTLVVESISFRPQRLLTLIY